MIGSYLKAIIIGISIACIILMLKPELISNKLAKSTPSSSSDNSYTYAIEQSAPAVVNIYLKALTPVNNNDSDIINSASGIIVDSDGYILTNYHVIMPTNQMPTSLGVMLRDGTNFNGKVIGYDKRTDLAVIKISSNKPLPTIKTNPDRPVRLGDVVLAIGNPLNLGQTVTHGIISAVGRTGSGITNFNTIDLTAGIQELLQTDAPINEGNSGGALVNTYGELVGINTATLNNNTGTNGISFAIPQKLAFKIMKDLITHGRVIRGYLGITARDISDLRFSNLTKLGIHGIIVNHINPEGPSAGILQPNDIILSINNQQVLNLQNAMELIADSEPGAIVKFKLFRQGKTLDATVQVTEQPTN